VRKIFRRDGHCQSHGNAELSAALNDLLPNLSKIGATQFVLRGELRSVELQIQLKLSVPERFPELIGKCIVLRQTHAVRIEQHIIEPGISVTPGEQLEELRMQSRLPTGKLQNLNATFAIDHSLDPSLEIDQRHRIDLTGMRRIRVARRAREIARVHNLDQREAGRQRLAFPHIAAKCIGPQRSLMPADPCAPAGAAILW
jgi:hypothetical protein